MMLLFFKINIANISYYTQLIFLKEKYVERSEESYYLF